MKNLIQYASFLVAVGCELNYDTATAELEIVSYPSESHKRQAIQEAIADIEKFLDTANRSDGMAAIALAQFVDHYPNPLGEACNRILNALGVMRGDKFIAAVMMQAKANRSWHTSEIANECSYFGEICTHRGVQIDPKKRGIRSTRNPEEYHTTQGNVIKREQLITPSLEAAYSLIPDSMLTTTKPPSVISANVEKQIEQLGPNDLDKLIATLQEKRAMIGASN